MNLGTMFSTFWGFITGVVCLLELYVCYIILKSKKDKDIPGLNKGIKVGYVLIAICIMVFLYVSVIICGEINLNDASDNSDEVKDARDAQLGQIWMSAFWRVVVPAYIIKESKRLKKALEERNNMENQNNNGN
eukprot:CAMPEP_0114590224 /NCGR_PEP_ID=MMETSP0125-20121206/12509_1 /TAXON_ID=485358 ORGANISM="Aristerostoma sp., Strain ATCC 50986" /NCGR_SAMPLE_ID=MMETSP0125 /ASSEMBLY_ACC=CAM_ASM_000245 /LENGTH=132 /DNA_ID=CAMNT_0001787571 /DNA_START=453 /DNA_END=851 /DNA_ORIENTATION=+